MTESVQQFNRHFSQHLDQIASLNNSLYKKILFLSALDSLSIAYDKDITQNKKRVLKMVANLSDWPDKDKVSTIQLQLQLELHFTSETLEQSKLYKILQDKISKWMKGHIYYSSEDYSLQDCWHQANEKERKVMEQAHYLELLYAQRNNLIHEFRQAGHGMELSCDNTKAYYHSIINKGWQLVFPLGLYEMICRASLSNLIRHLQTKNINPYEQYDFEDIWIKTKCRR